MTRVLISGMGGRLATSIVAAIESTDDLSVSGGYNPHDPELSDPSVPADVVLEVTRPDVVIDNLTRWHSRGLPCVVGTSGFSSDRVEEVRGFWGEDDPGCLIVPNFSVGAVLMMQFAESAAPWFGDVEIVERHHADKPDAPSGTSLATAERIADRGGASADAGDFPARGLAHRGISIHSMRHAGVVAEQEVLFSSKGETLRIVHVSGDYRSFHHGALLALRAVSEMAGVHVGLDVLLQHPET
ncbi:MAG: 4-hydroxy-tetrahydrodipicolinate reductase [Actinobacteria bacterium]|nr:4-hydroxy-tetrahydrodipicolinate reductase [Actinomycetota bacterium]